LVVREHNEYNQEKNRLDYTVDQINKEIQLNEDTDFSNMDEYVAKDFYNMITAKLRNLKLAKHSPYFGRTDFKEIGKDKVQKLYIGKTGLMNKDNNEMIIVDWRAPISSLYYDGSIGQANYNCPDGNIKGELSLKRQYLIEQAKLKEISDVEIATNDDLLLECLKGGKDNRLKDIVSTIQADQNKIIRADMGTPLIVQGVAGSGKTTIALHRIAYLVYTFEKAFKPEEFINFCRSSSYGVHPSVTFKGERLCL